MTLERTHPRPFLAARLAMTALCAAGCGTVATVHLDQHELGQELESRGVDPQLVILPFGLTDEMREWVEEAISPVASDERKLEITCREWPGEPVGWLRDPSRSRSPSPGSV